MNTSCVVKGGHCTLPLLFYIQSGLDNLVAPNGKQLERRDRIALFLAEKVLAAVGNTDDAIPVYISDAKFGHNQFIVS